MDRVRKGTVGGEDSHRISIRSNRTSIHTDAAEYYRNYEPVAPANGNGEEVLDTNHSIEGNIVGECYLNFSKLL